MSFANEKLFPVTMLCYPSRKDDHDVGLFYEPIFISKPYNLKNTNFFHVAGLLYRFLVFTVCSNTYVMSK